jgi:hypothetical protein
MYSEETIEAVISDARTFFAHFNLGDEVDVISHLKENWPKYDENKQARKLKRHITAVAAHCPAFRNDFVARAKDTLDRMRRVGRAHDRVIDHTRIHVPVDVHLSYNIPEHEWHGRVQKVEYVRYAGDDYTPVGGYVTVMTADGREVTVENVARVDEQSTAYAETSMHFDECVEFFRARRLDAKTPERELKAFVDWHEPKFAKEGHWDGMEQFIRDCAELTYSGQFDEDAQNFFGTKDKPFWNLITNEGNRDGEFWRIKNGDVLAKHGYENIYRGDATGGEKLRAGDALLSYDEGASMSVVYLVESAHDGIDYVAKNTSGGFAKTKKLKYNEVWRRRPKMDAKVRESILAVLMMRDDNGVLISRQLKRAGVPYTMSFVDPLHAQYKNTLGYGPEGKMYTAYFRAIGNALDKLPERDMQFISEHRVVFGEAERNENKPWVKWLKYVDAMSKLNVDVLQNRLIFERVHAKLTTNNDTKSSSDDWMVTAKPVGWTVAERRAGLAPGDERVGMRCNMNMHFNLIYLFKTCGLNFPVGAPNPDPNGTPCSIVEEKGKIYAKAGDDYIHSGCGNTEFTIKTVNTNGAHTRRLMQSGREIFQEVSSNGKTFLGRICREVRGDKLRSLYNKPFVDLQDRFDYGVMTDAARYVDGAHHDNGDGRVILLGDCDGIYRASYQDIVTHMVKRSRMNEPLRTSEVVTRLVHRAETENQLSTHVVQDRAEENMYEVTRTLPIVRQLWLARESDSVGKANRKVGVTFPAGDDVLTGTYDEQSNASKMDEKFKDETRSIKELVEEMRKDDYARACAAFACQYNEIKDEFVMFRRPKSMYAEKNRPVEYKDDKWYTVHDIEGGKLKYRARKGQTDLSEIDISEIEKVRTPGLELVSSFRLDKSDSPHVNRIYDALRDREKWTLQKWMDEYLLELRAEKERLEKDGREVREIEAALEKYKDIKYDEAKTYEENDSAFRRGDWPQYKEKGGLSSLVEDMLAVRSARKCSFSKYIGDVPPLRYSLVQRATAVEMLHLWICGKETKVPLWDVEEFMLREIDGDVAEENLELHLKRLALVKLLQDGMTERERRTLFGRRERVNWNERDGEVTADLKGRYASYPDTYKILTGSTKVNNDNSTFADLLELKRLVMPTQAPLQKAAPRGRDEPPFPFRHLDEVLGMMRAVTANMEFLADVDDNVISLELEPKLDMLLKYLKRNRAIHASDDYNIVIQIADHMIAKDDITIQNSKDHDIRIASSSDDKKPKYIKFRDMEVKPYVEDAVREYIPEKENTLGFVKKMYAGNQTEQLIKAVESVLMNDTEEARSTLSDVYQKCDPQGETRIEWERRRVISDHSKSDKRKVENEHIREAYMNMRRNTDPLFSEQNIVWRDRCDSDTPCKAIEGKLDDDVYVNGKLQSLTGAVRNGCMRCARSAYVALLEHAIVRGVVNETLAIVKHPPSDIRTDLVRLSQWCRRPRGKPMRPHSFLGQLRVQRREENCWRKYAEVWNKYATEKKEIADWGDRDRARLFSGVRSMFTLKKPIVVEGDDGKDTELKRMIGGKEVTLTYFDLTAWVNNKDHHQYREGFEGSGPQSGDHIFNDLSLCKEKVEEVARRSETERPPNLLTGYVAATPNETPNETPNAAPNTESISATYGIDVIPLESTL